jgi:hypothetical protein
MVGLLTDDRGTTDIAFDILSVEALFLVPRYVGATYSKVSYYGLAARN